MMKPVRGSARSSKRGPQAGGQQGKQLKQLSQKPMHNGEVAQGKSKKGVVHQVKGREKWKPLPKASLLFLDNMLDLSILSILTIKKKEKEESQKHLNLLKNNFLTKCSQLPVPPQKYGQLTQVTRQFHTECEKVMHGKKKIDAIEESNRLVVSKLEQLQVETDSLDHKCKLTRDKLEKAQLNAHEFIQLSEQTVLHLPSLSPYLDHEPTLQEQIMKMVSKPQEVMKILQKSKVTRRV